MGTANQRHPDRPHGSDTSLRRGRFVGMGMCGPYDRDRIPSGSSSLYECRRSLPKLRAASSMIDPQSGKEVIL